MPFARTRQANIQCSGIGPSGETSYPLCRRHPAVFHWPCTQPSFGQDCIQYEKAGWPGDTYLKPASTGSFLIETTRATRHWPSDGKAAAQTRHSNHGAILAARYGPNDTALGRRIGYAFLAEAAWERL